jgi:hypothetical protein
MQPDRLQLQRFELKYLVTEHVALAVRDFVGSYLELDSNCHNKPDNSYLNHSYYLDSGDLHCFWSVINGNLNRFKMRLRFYDENPKGPVFFEIKRRVNAAILKQRGPVHRWAVPLLLAGHPPEPQHLMSDHPKHLAAVQSFSNLILAHRAGLKTHVSYLREAWVSRSNNSVRVTMDREVCVCPRFTPELTTRQENPVMPWGPQVILELKFTGRFPDWFGELVRIFGIRQCGVAKYAEGVDELGEERLAPMRVANAIARQAADEWRKQRAERNSQLTVMTNP